MSEIRVKEKNECTIVGVLDEFKFDHKIKGEKFYNANLRVTRISGEVDIIPINVSGYIIDKEQLELKDVTVYVEGSMRSYIIKESEHTAKSNLCIFVNTILFEEEDKFDIYTNHVIFEGHICKEPIYRITLKKGKQITDVKVKVDYSHFRSAYIPCITWDRKAIHAAKMKVGDKVICEGRLQSRVKKRYIEEGNFKTVNFCEVSLDRIEAIEEK